MKLELCSQVNSIKTEIERHFINLDNDEIKKYKGITKSNAGRII